MLVVRSKNNIAAMHKTNYTDLITESRIFFPGIRIFNSIHSVLKELTLAGIPSFRFDVYA